MNFQFSYFWTQESGIERKGLSPSSTMDSTDVPPVSSRGPEIEISPHTVIFFFSELLLTTILLEEFVTYFTTVYTCRPITITTTSLPSYCLYHCHHITTTIIEPSLCQYHHTNTQPPPKPVVQQSNNITMFIVW